jgi:hypothetical protein
MHTEPHFPTSWHYQILRLNPLLSEARVKRKDFPEVARLPWEHPRRGPLESERACLVSRRATTRRMVFRNAVDYRGFCGISARHSRTVCRNTSIFMLRKLTLSCQIVVKVGLLELSASETAHLSIPNIRSPDLVVFVDVFYEYLRAWL